MELQDLFLALKQTYEAGSAGRVRKISDSISHRVNLGGGLSRRNFLRLATNIGIGAAIAFEFPQILSCVTPTATGSSSSIDNSVQDYDLQELPEKGWKKLRREIKIHHPIFGVQILRGMYGFNDFKGHNSDHIGSTSPGVDYEMPGGTPTVPAAQGFLHSIGNHQYGGINIWLRHLPDTQYRTVYGHLSRTIVDKKFYHGKSSTQRLIARNEIIALSGNSGQDRYGIMPYHLHFGLQKWNYSKNKSAFIDPDIQGPDPDGAGPDRGLPVYWDGKTKLDFDPEVRHMYLERTVKELGKEMESMPKGDHDLEELKGNLNEDLRLMGSIGSRKIADSFNFQNMREMLKNVTLDAPLDGLMYKPGDPIYSIMLRIVGYSTPEKQKIIFTLPYIAPGLEHLYKEPVLEDGQFLSWRMYGGKGK